MDHEQHSFQQEPISFSFDNPFPHPRPPRTISKCLKLTTHESIDDQAFPSIQLNQGQRLGLNIDESEIESERCLRLTKNEYELRIESLIKQYELRLAKQQECYALQEWKLKEEIENLREENDKLGQQLKKSKIIRPSQSQCSICSDGQVIAHYHKVLLENEQHHQGCLAEKKELTCKIGDLTAKIAPLQEEYEKVCDQLRKVQRALRNSMMTIRQVQTERDHALNQVAEINEKWREKLSIAEGESKQLKRELAQRDAQLTQSKATIISTHSTSNRTSLKSSSLLKAKDVREDKENDFGRKSSVNKILIEDHHCKPLMENHEHNAKSNWAFRQQPMRWKYF